MLKKCSCARRPFRTSLPEVKPPPTPTAWALQPSCNAKPYFIHFIGIVTVIGERLWYSLTYLTSCDCDSRFFEAFKRYLFSVSSCTGVMLWCRRDSPVGCTYPRNPIQGGPKMPGRNLPPRKCDKINIIENLKSGRSDYLSGFHPSTYFDHIHRLCKSRAHNCGQAKDPMLLVWHLLFRKSGRGL